MIRFQRNYRLTLETNDGQALIIEPPFTVQFNIERSVQGTLNSAQFQIYNQGQQTRSRIFQDRFNPRDYKRVVFEAGYNNLNVIFKGNMFQARSMRQGPELITYIDARDGGFDANNTISNVTIQAGATAEEIVKTLLGDFDNVTEGNLAGLEGGTKRPVVLNGNTFSLIKKYSNNKAFIDLEQINVLKDNQTIEGVLPLINSSTGLLQTPQREDAFLRIETIFRPEIVVGQLLEVQSSVNPEYDGQYKVIGLRHQGTISEAVSADARSTFDLLVGSQLLGEFNQV